MEPVHSFVQSITNVAPTTAVYDFFEIDKFFPAVTSSGNDNIMAGDEQRLIPIYICRPLQQVVKMTALQIEQADILKELSKIDEAKIEVVLRPAKRETDHIRKSRLIPLAYVQERLIGDSSRVKKESSQESNQSSPPLSIKRECEEDQGVKEEEGEEVTDTSQESRNDDEEPMAVAEDPTTATLPVDNIIDPTVALSPIRPDDEAPQFQCDKCERQFYLKRALRRHQYTHKK